MLADPEHCFSPFFPFFFRLFFRLFSVLSPGPQSPVLNLPSHLGYFPSAEHAENTRKTRDFTRVLFPHVWHVPLCLNFCLRRW